MEIDKKIAAAIAAVSMYLEAEQQALYAQAAADAAQAPAVTQHSTNIWGVSGRQTMMQMRNLMQMKGLHGSRL